MKANELMISDWVKTPKGFFKVTDIQDNDVIGTDYNNGEGADSLFFSDEIEPIPLTAEILEKNGFIHYDVTDFWMWKEESSEPIHLDNYDKDGWRLRINCDNIPCECKFVHQLQHALRICGIEKEIEL